MITSFRHKGLERFWTDNDRKKLPADQINKIDRILDLLDEIEELPKDLLPFPGSTISIITKGGKYAQEIKTTRSSR